MRILVTNDDGIKSPCIHALARELLKVGDVIMMAPETERSGAGHSITLGAPVAYRRFEDSTDMPCYCVSGTPVDCVRVALDVLDKPFDMVVSGINTGANVGLNIHYSGTVAAALEAAFVGRMGLAVSISTRKPRNIETAAVLGAQLAGFMIEKGVQQVLNLNVPDLPLDEIRGIRITKTSITEEDTALAINGNCLEINDECSDMEYVLDSRAVAAGYASVTPLQLDLTARDRLQDVKEWIWRFDRND